MKVQVKPSSVQPSAAPLVLIPIEIVHEGFKVVFLIIYNENGNRRLSPNTHAQWHTSVIDHLFVYDLVYAVLWSCYAQFLWDS